MGKGHRVFLKVISVYEVLGGLAGLLVILFSVLPALAKQVGNPHLSFLYVLVVVFLILFLLSILGGVFLWLRKGAGYVMSFIAQLFQIPFIVTSSIIYTFIAGLSVAPYFTRGSVGVTFYIGGKFLFYLKQMIPNYQIGINLIALFLAIWILLVWKKKENS